MASGHSNVVSMDFGKVFFCSPLVNVCIICVKVNKVMDNICTVSNLYFVETSGPNYLGAHNLKIIHRRNPISTDCWFKKKSSKMLTALY